MSAKKKKVTDLTQVVKFVPIGKLDFAEYNPRHIKKDAFERLKKSLDCTNGKKFFQIKPCFVNQRDGKLIVYAGNQRLRAAQDLGWTEVPCHIDKISLAEEKERNIKDNNPAGEWDFDVLANNFDLDDLENWGMDMAALEVGSIEENEIEEDEVPDPPKKSRAKKGVVYNLGEHRIICGDASNPEDVKKLMDGKKGDLFISDPPYNVDYVGKTKDSLKIQNDKKEDGEFREFLRLSFFCADKNLKEGGVFYIWHADSEGYNFRGACVDIGWRVRQCLIWNKNSMVMGRQDYHCKHEPCLYGWKDGGAHLWSSDRKQVTILEFDRPARSEEHPTMKPVKLIAYLIGNNSKEGDICLDTFLGSGTTLIASDQMNRICYGIEIDPKYVDVIIQRYCNHKHIDADEIYADSNKKCKK